MLFRNMSFILEQPAFSKWREGGSFGGKMGLGVAFFTTNLTTVGLLNYVQVSM